MTVPLNFCLPGHLHVIGLMPLVPMHSASVSQAVLLQPVSCSSFCSYTAIGILPKPLGAWKAHALSKAGAWDSNKLFGKPFCMKTHQCCSGAVTQSLDQGIPQQTLANVEQVDVVSKSAVKSASILTLASNKVRPKIESLENHGLWSMVTTHSRSTRS